MKIKTIIEENKLGRRGDPLGPKSQEFWILKKIEDTKISFWNFCALLYFGAATIWELPLLKNLRYSFYSIKVRLDDVYLADWNT